MGAPMDGTPRLSHRRYRGYRPHLLWDNAAQYMVMDVPAPKKDFFDVIITALYSEPFPTDLKIILAWLVLAVAGIYLPIVNSSPLRVVFALPVVLFIPGYCLIAALFPNKSDLDGIERTALSFGLSIALVPLIGLGLNYTPWGIRLDPIVISLVIFTVSMLVIALFRRATLPADERFTVPFRSIVNSARGELFPETGSQLDRILSVVLLVAIIAAVGTTIYVIAVPKEGEKFTEFYILGEKKMAADYPDRLFTGLTYPMYIGIGNHEYRNVTYTVETYLEQVNFNESSNSSTIERMDPLDHFTVTLPHNSTKVIPYTLTAPSTGYNRVEFLLFNETVPAISVTGMDRINASYRDLHLWVTVRPKPIL